MANSSSNTLSSGRSGRLLSLGARVAGHELRGRLQSGWTRAPKPLAEVHHRTRVLQAKAIDKSCPAFIAAPLSSPRLLAIAFA